MRKDWSLTTSSIWFEESKTMKAKDIIYIEALEVQAAIHDDNDFYTLDEALARLSAVINMASVLKLVVGVEVEEAKARAKKDYLNKSY